jgi:PadR family transcriptional regulator PadR
MKKLTINEQIFLIAVWHLKEQAYGVNIRDKIMALTGESLLFGTLYNTLDALVRKEYLAVRKGERTTQWGGQNKLFYRITDEGRAALQNARRLQETLWKGVPRGLPAED